MLRRFLNTQPSRARTGLSLDDSGLALACVERTSEGRTRLERCAFQSGTGNADWRQSAVADIARLGLDESPVSSVMPAGNYQLLLVETPDVPAEEVSAAVRWRVKDLLDFNLDEAVIEVFDMPEQSNRGQKPMVHVVATRRTSVQQQVELADAAGLPLDVIDIPELCIRNVAALLPQDAEGVAFLHLAEDDGILTVTQQGILYVIRRIEIGRRSFRDVEDLYGGHTELLSGISLEVQRSLDYYESHYDRKPITDLVLGPGPELGSLPGFLREELGLNVHVLDLGELFEMATPIPADEQASCLLAVGAAMRAEAAAV